jgi:hypothetical protein
LFLDISSECCGWNYTLGSPGILCKLWGNSGPLTEDPGGYFAHYLYAEVLQQARCSRECVESRWGGQLHYPLFFYMLSKIPALVWAVHVWSAFGCRQTSLGEIGEDESHQRESQ